MMSIEIPSENEAGFTIRILNFAHSGSQAVINGVIIIWIPVQAKDVEVPILTADQRFVTAAHIKLFDLSIGRKNMEVTYR